MDVLHGADGTNLLKVITASPLTGNPIQRCHAAQAGSASPRQIRAAHWKKPLCHPSRLE